MGCANTVANGAATVFRPIRSIQSNLSSPSFYRLFFHGNRRRGDHNLSLPTRDRSLPVCPCVCHALVPQANQQGHLQPSLAQEISSHRSALHQPHQEVRPCSGGYETLAVSGERLLCERKIAVCGCDDGGGATRGRKSSLSQDVRRMR